MAKTRTWLSILIAGVVSVVMLGTALAGGSAYWLYRHVNTRFTSHESATAEFNGERARFEGRQPLVEMRPGEDPVVHRASTKALQTDLKAIHALFYDPREEKLVRATFPFWVLRVAPRSQIGFFSEDSDLFGELHLTLEDLEQRGPGLVLDMKDVPIRGGQVLVWTD